MVRLRKDIGNLKYTGILLGDGSQKKTSKPIAFSKRQIHRSQFELGCQIFLHTNTKNCLIYFWRSLIGKFTEENKS